MANVTLKGSIYMGHSLDNENFAFSSRYMREPLLHNMQLPEASCTLAMQRA